MAQEILLKRSSATYTSETAAWSALNNHTFKKGEPIVAFYNKEDNSVHGDELVAAIYAIGTADGKGKYQAFASYEDFYAVWTQADLNAKAILELQQTLNAMWKLENGVLYTTHTVVAEGDGVFGGDYSGGGGGGTGEGGSSTLAGLIDVKDNGAGSVAGSSGSAAAVGSLFAFNGTDWYAITKAELATAMKQPLIDADIATKSFVNTAIQNAKDVRVDTLIDKDTNKSVRTITNEVVAGMLASADADFDTLIEIADYLEGHSEDAVQMSNDIKALKSRTITAGDGLTGGGDLSEDRTIKIVSANDGISVNADNIQLNAINNLTSDSTSKPLSAAQGKQLQANITALGNKKITAGNGLSGDITLSSGGTMSVNVDNSSIVITSNKLGVSVIDGGTF